MKTYLVILMCWGQVLFSSAQLGNLKGDPPLKVAPRAWLGLHVEKPDETITAHVPSLPQGMGFVVAAIDDGGPAQRAGLAKLDLLWKFEEQMLVNEAQLAALLRLSQPGQTVAISGFRGGKAFEVKLKLGEAPATAMRFPGDMVESSVLPTECAGPMRVVNVAEKTASFSTEEGRAVVRREAEVFKVKIEGPEGNVIFEGDLARGARAQGLSENWQRRIEVLCRSLDQALDGGMMGRRQPRPRVIVPASSMPSAQNP